MDPGKVQAIIDWPTPTTVKEVQQFNGLAGYYRQYIAGFANIAKGLTELFKGEQKFYWGKEQQEAFQTLKKKFTEAPVRQLYDPEKPGIIYVDASDYGIGGVYCQEDPDSKTRKPRPIAFYSRQFHGAEINYDVYDKELLAIVQVMDTWRHYCQGAKHKVTIYSDHKNLTYFTTTKQLTRRHARWAQKLSRFNFEIKHIKGTENVIADALSRRPDYEK
ncbi:MAG TPA: ribonuclease H family protein [Puia sp.]|nr:ribonuclease H family protein [Puia sp.]